jgi:RNA polymerase sigma-32 factor
MNTQVMKLPSLSPGLDIDSYLRILGQFPILSAGEEHTLATKFTEEGDLDAARKLVLGHLRFVAYLARSYKGYGLPYEDLVQEGNVGLMKAVKRFDPSFGVRLISFAAHWIKAEIHEYILKNWRIVKVATTKAQRKLFFNLRSAKKSFNWLDPQETLAIANDLGVSSEEVARMEGRLSANDLAFDSSGESEDDDDSSTPAYYLASDAPNPADLVESRDVKRRHAEQLSIGLATLDDRARDIIQRRWLADKKATLHELADEYSVSAERIRQLESAAITKMRTFVAQEEM